MESSKFITLLFNKTFVKVGSALNIGNNGGEHLAKHIWDVTIKKHILKDTWEPQKQHSEHLAKHMG